MNYFELLNIEQSFEIDLTTLEKNYLELQQQFHPDMFAGKSASEKLAATQKTADINDAYETLCSIQKRAEYILKINGYQINERELSKNVSQETLTESMECREALDDAEDTIQIENLTRGVAAKKKESMETLREHFSFAKYEDAFKETVRLKYLDKFLLEAKAKLQEIGEQDAA